jgi:hypothetical protein
VLADARMEPDAKRLKRAEASSPAVQGVVRPEVLSDSSRKALRHACDTSQPYYHLIIRDLCDDQLLRQVRDEVINNIQATYKETDLFKVFQTGVYHPACSAGS